MAFRAGLGLISRWTGLVAQNHWSPRVNRLLIEGFARTYGIALDDAEKSVDDFVSLDDFFTRRLKPSLRPVAAPPVHPCDGRLTRVDRVERGQLLQVKGVAYPVADLVGNPGAVEALEGGWGLTYYLSPSDCHRVFAPVSGHAVACRHLPGALWPVNAWGLRAVRGLFVTNERVVFEFDIGAGRRAFLVMVGALNVGQIEVSFDSRVFTNSVERPEPAVFEYDPPHRIVAGDEVGVFHLGSSVVVLYPPGVVDGPPTLGPVRYGQSL